MTGAMVECLKLESCKSVALHDMCQLTILALGNAMSGWSFVHEPVRSIILAPTMHVSGSHVRSITV